MRLDFGDGGARAFAVVFQQDDPKAAVAVAQVDSAGGGDPGAGVARAGGLAVSGDRERWEVRFAGDASHDGELELVLELEPWGTAAADEQAAGAARSAEHAAARWSAAVSGTVRLQGQAVQLDAAGQASVWHAAERPVVVREIQAWWESRRAFSLQAVGTSPRAGHDRESLAAAGADGGEPPLAQAFDDARLSTTYDAAAVPRLAGLELWPTEESDYARRVTGQAVARTSVLTDVIGSGRKAFRLRYDCVWMSWRMEGEEGAGPYTLIRAMPDR